MKVEAVVHIRIKPLEGKGEKPLRVWQAPAWPAKSRKADVRYERQYRNVKKAECPQTKPAVVVDGSDAGSDAGTLLHLFLDQKCSVHARVSNYQPTPQEGAARAKELLAERIEKESRVKILNAVREKLPTTLSRSDLEMAVLDYFERPGHDNHRRLCRVYGREERKTKAAWGGSCVDYKVIAQKAVRGMSMREVQHFRVVGSLVSDLYCPGYNPKQALAKNSNLACAAARYKIDVTRLSAKVRSELSAKKEKGDTRKTSATTGKQP